MTIRTTRVTKRVVAAVATAALGATLLALPTSPVGATGTVTTVRIAGADREATSVAIAAGADALGADSTDFVLANSRSYADSVTASALAGKLGGTIILLPNDGSLSAAAKTQLAGAAVVHIVGGTSAVPDSVLAAVQSASTGSTVFTRHAGATRFATAKLVAAEVGAPGLLASKKTVFLVNADNHADAVTASPAAYAGPHQMLLTSAASLNAVTKATIAAVGATQVVILGGTVAISAAVEAEVDAMTGVSVIRVAGTDRYDTANEFAKLLMKSSATGGFGWTAAKVGLANLSDSNGGADALAASAYLGQVKAPMLGTNNGALPVVTQAFLATNKAAVSELHVFGGTDAVPAAVVAACETAAGKLANPTAVITTSEKYPLAFITFSEPVTAATANVKTNYQILAPGGAAELNSEITSVALTVATGATTGTSAVMTLANPATKAVKGATIQVLPNVVKTADGRGVTATSVVIADDATKPAATLQAIVGTASGSTQTFKVSFSEPVVGALANTNFKVNAVPLTAAFGGVVYKLNDVTSTLANYNSALVTVDAADAFGQAETLSINAGTSAVPVVADFAGNKSTAASTVVAADSVAPTFASATVAVTAATTAQVVTGGGNLLIQAKTAGVQGNDVSVVITSIALGATSTISVTGNAISIAIEDGTVTPTAIKGLIAANAAANALVSVTVLDNTAGLFAVATNTLAGGTSLAVVTSTFSETITVATAADITYDGDAVGGGGAAVAGTNPAKVTGNVVVTKHTLTATNQLPTLNIADVIYAAAAVRDIGQNPLVGPITKVL